MACNCGKNLKVKTYIYTDHIGSRTVYQNAVQAQAAKVKNGGKGKIDVVSR